MFLSAQAFPIPGYQRLVNTRAYGILFLPNQLLLMSLKKEKIVFSQNKSPLPEIDSSLPKGILKTFSLCIYFILKHLQLLSKLGLTKTLHSKNNIESMIKQCQSKNARCLAPNDTLILPIIISLEIRPSGKMF